MARVLSICADNVATPRSPKASKLARLPRPVPLGIGPGPSPLTAAEERRLLEKLRALARKDRTLVWKLEFWFDHYLSPTDVRIADYVTQRERDHDKG